MKLKSKIAVMISVSLMSVAISAAIAAPIQFISIATGGTGGTYFFLGSGMAKIIEKYVPDEKLSCPYFTGTVKGWPLSTIVNAKTLNGAVALTFFEEWTSLGNKYHVSPAL